MFAWILGNFPTKIESIQPRMYNAEELKHLDQFKCYTLFQIQI